MKLKWLPMWRKIFIAEMITYIGIYIYLNFLKIQSKQKIIIEIGSQQMMMSSITIEWTIKKKVLHTHLNIWVPIYTRTCIYSYRYVDNTFFLVKLMPN